jgi:epsilon-lactone hydrolase
MARTPDFDTKSHLLAFAGLLGRAATLQDMRRAFETYPIDSAPIADSVIYEIGEPPGTWIGNSISVAGRRGVYLHGGGYVAGSTKMYAGLVSRLAAATRSWIFVPDIPLAPERQFPAAHEAAIGATRYVIGNSPFTREGSTRVYLAGDSCGSALALVTGMKFRDEQESNSLSAIVGLSPVLDMTASAESYIRCAASDKIVSRDSTRQCISMYAPVEDPNDPALSPLCGSFAGLPPVLLQVSEDEAASDDSTQAALLAKQQGCQLEVQNWRGLPHVWHLLAPYLPEADIAIARVGQFIGRAFGDED